MVSKSVTLSPVSVEGRIIYTPNNWLQLISKQFWTRGRNCRLTRRPYPSKHGMHHILGSPFWPKKTISNIHTYNFCETISQSIHFSRCLHDQKHWMHHKDSTIHHHVTTMFQGDQYTDMDWSATNENTNYSINYRRSSKLRH